MRNYVISALAASVQAVNLTSEAAAASQAFAQLLTDECVTFTWEMDFHEVLDNMSACFGEHINNFKSAFPPEFDWANNLDVLAEALAGFVPTTNDPEPETSEPGEPVDPVTPDPVAPAIDLNAVMAQIGAHVGVDMGAAYPIDYDWVENAHTLTDLVTLPLGEPDTDAVTQQQFSQLFTIVPSMFLSYRHMQQVYVTFANDPYEGLSVDEQNDLWRELMQGVGYLERTEEDGNLPGHWSLDFSLTLDEFREEFLRQTNDIVVEDWLLSLLFDQVSDDFDWVNPWFLQETVSSAWSSDYGTQDFPGFTEMCFKFGLYDLDAITKMFRHFESAPLSVGQDPTAWGANAISFQQSQMMWKAVINAPSVFGFTDSIFEDLGEPRWVQEPLPSPGIDDWGVWHLDFTVPMSEFRVQHETIFGVTQVTSNTNDSEFANPDALTRLVSEQFGDEPDEILDLTEFLELAALFGMTDYDAVTEMHDHYMVERASFYSFHFNMWRNLMAYPDEFGWNGSVWAMLAAQ